MQEGLVAAEDGGAGEADEELADEGDEEVSIERCGARVRGEGPAEDEEAENHCGGVEGHVCETGALEGEVDGDALAANGGERVGRAGGDVEAERLAAPRDVELAAAQLAA